MHFFFFVRVMNDIFRSLLIFETKNAIFCRKHDVEFFIFNFDYGLCFLTFARSICWMIIFHFCVVFFFLLTTIEFCDWEFFQKCWLLKQTLLFWLRFGQIFSNDEGFQKLLNTIPTFYFIDTFSTAFWIFAIRILYKN